MEKLKKIADEWGLWIVEDGCHAPGGYFVKNDGQFSFCGSCEFSDLTTFSLHPAKHIAAGEGGMITTNDEKLYKKLLYLRTHGIIKNGDFINESSFASAHEESNFYPKWYMEMIDLGFNYRLTDFQCALGLNQLKD